MNPNIKKAIPPVVHILFCVVILLMPLLVMSYSSSQEHTIDYKFYTSYWIRIGGLIAVFYFNYLYLIDKFLFNKKLSPYFFINILVITAVIAFQDLLFDLFRDVDMPRKPPHINNDPNMPKPPPKEMKLVWDYAAMILSIGMSVALKATMRWYKDSINLETIKAIQLETNLRNLRNQLNPHFLFNTLNNIYSLIASDTSKAQESVYRLSGMLRYVLYENNNKFVPIAKEIEFTQNYIDLMALRLAPNVKLNVLIKDNDGKNEIASLMFITLIENAFKHGINHKKESYIDIKIYVAKDEGVLCTVENSLGDKDDLESKNSGIGLSNLQKRLELLYPKRHRFEIKQDDTSFSVLLSIDFTKD